MSKDFTEKSSPLRFLDFCSGLMWAMAWIILAYTIATPAATIASALGALAAFFLGRQLAHSTLRSPTLVGAVCLLGPVLLSLADFPNRSPFVAGFFPSANVLVFVTDFLWWGLLAALVVGLLQFLSTRYQVFVSLEVLTVALFLATPFAAHRDGFINRPYFLIDPLWSQGYDPVPVLQGLGLVVAIALILLTIGRATKRSSVLDLALLSFLALILYLYVPQEAIRDMVSDPSGTSGLTGKPKEEEGQGGQPPPSSGGGNSTLAGESGSGSNNSDNQFPFESSEKSEPKPVAVAIFRDDYESPDGYYYFRQSAFSQFNGFRLVKDTTGKADVDLFKRFPTKLETTPPPPPRADIPTTRLETRIALISSHTEPFGLVKPLEMKPVPNPNPDKFERAYEVVSHVYKGNYNEILTSKLQDPSWDEETKAHYLQYPDNDERYKQLADEIISGIPLEYRDYPLARVLAINLYLGEKGKYTVKKRPVQGAEDPTADFLFGDMTGYCVHFAHSSVYLLRAAGVQARVGVGYAVEGRDRRGSALMILSSRAHVWPEVWVDGLGWYPMDVAPQTNLDTPTPPPDFDLQSMLAEMAREDGEEFDQVEQVNLRLLLKNFIEMLWAFLPWLVGGFLILAYGLKLERRFGYRFVSGEAKIHALFKAALDKAYDAGFSRERGQGRLSFAEQHSQALPSLTPLTKAHLSCRFGKSGQKFDPAQSLSDLRKFQTELNQTTPLWRRTLGALNPLSWYFTH